MAEFFLGIRTCDVLMPSDVNLLDAFESSILGKNRFELKFAPSNSRSTVIAHVSAHLSDVYPDGSEGLERCKLSSQPPHERELSNMNPERSFTWQTMQHTTTGIQRVACAGQTIFIVGFPR